MRVHNLRGSPFMDAICWPVRRFRAEQRRKTEELIKEHERWVLSERDSQRFFEVLAAPPAPSARLQQAAERYRASVISNA